MFLEFYKLREQPFGVTPDPRFLYLSESHREALASLHYGLESDRGFVALIAQPGLGKTTLVFQLLEKLQRDSRSVFLFQTQCNSKEFFNYVLNSLGTDCEGMGLVSMHKKLNEILSREMLAGRRFILAIDEAQNLDLEVLETVRLLSNFETSQAKLLQILLIGQPQLAQRLASPELDQLQQRISVFARLEPFGFDDTARYISHRLHVAGYEGPSLFTPDALQVIAEQSQGIPRKINGLCFSALSLGYALGRRQVDVAMMQEVIEDRFVESVRESVRESVTPRPIVAEPVVAERIPPKVEPFRAAFSERSPEPKRGFTHSALGAASLGACVAIGIGLLSLSVGKVDRANRMPADRAAAAQISAPLAPEKDRVETQTVIVKPGDTLAEIVIRTMGDYNEATLAQVRKLNPQIDNVGHIEIGETIRIPQYSLPPASPVANDGTGEAAKDTNVGQQ